MSPKKSARAKKSKKRPARKKAKKTAKKKASRKPVKKAGTKPASKKPAKKAPPKGAGPSGAAALAQLDHKAIWHPFTQQAAWVQEATVVIDNGKGNYLFDVNGNKYFDGVSSLWCNVHGHRVPEIDAAVKKQLGKIAHSTFLGLSHEPGIELAAKLLEVAPEGLTRVFYSDAGANAVEVALKMAYQYHQLTEGPETTKTQFAYFSEGYHGDTLGAVSVGGIDDFHKRFAALYPKHLKVDLTAWHKRPRGEELQARAVAMAELEFKITRNAKKLAAVIIEPMMQGAGGMKTIPGGYLLRLRELCNAHNILLVCDEVATGFGRTGKMFACEHESVSPDLLCVGKGISAGYFPLSATLTSEKIYEAFLGRPEEGKTFFHGHTYTANPVACAAGVASLELFKKKKVLKNVEERSQDLAVWLREIEQHPHVRDCRFLGLMGGIELAPDPRDPTSAYSPARRVGHRVCMEARKRGVMLRPLGDTIVLVPPLSSTETEIDTLCAVVHECIHVVTGQEELFVQSAASW